MSSVDENQPSEPSAKKVTSQSQEKRSRKPRALLNLKVKNLESGVIPMPGRTIDILKKKKNSEQE